MASLYFKTYGEGEPIIILHGLFGMSDNWLTFGKKLAETNMVILVDVRDHGRSPHTEEFSYEAAANDLASLCEENWIYNAVVIGHSMGGKVAMKLANDHPELVRKLIIVDIAPVTYSGGHELIINTLSETDIKTAKSRSDIETQISKNIKEIGVVRFLMKNLTRSKDGGFKWKMNLPMLKDNYQNILSSVDLDTIDTSTLFIKGGNSEYIKTEYLEIIEEHFTDYRLETIENAGHWIHVDKPDDLHTLIVNFISD